MKVQAPPAPTARRDGALIAAIEAGLPLVPRPYAAIAERLGMREEEVITGMQRLLEDGSIKRLGIVVRHRELGYRANAMIVWDVPDAEVAEIGARLGRLPFVRLCYQRPRRPPTWPYNLFTMIHGRDRASVLEQIRWVVRECGLASVPHETLFSGRCFKQCGARYALSPGCTTERQRVKAEDAAA